MAQKKQKRRRSPPRRKVSGSISAESFAKFEEGCRSLGWTQQTAVKSLVCLLNVLTTEQMLALHQVGLGQKLPAEPLAVDLPEE